MARILANDGIADNGKKMLEDAGHEVVTDKIAQDDLIPHLNDFDAVIVRSATQIRKDIIDACPNLKMVVRAGVGMDNVDVEYGRSKGLEVTNTPEASSRAVAELVMGHIFSIARSLHMSQYEMRSKGDSEFKSLKKKYSKGFELQGKTVGIVGFGRIGQELAKLCFGIGMSVMAYDVVQDSRSIEYPEIEGDRLSQEVRISSLEELWANSDVISLHVPSLGKSLITKKELAIMKDGVVLINTARGGMIDEKDLIEAINSGKVRGAALDVFVNEPTPSADILSNPAISLSPHIGASTKEAQFNIGKLAAQKINTYFS